MLQVLLFITSQDIHTSLYVCGDVQSNVNVSAPWLLISNWLHYTMLMSSIGHLSWPFVSLEFIISLLLRVFNVWLLEHMMAWEATPKMHVIKLLMLSKGSHKYTIKHWLRCHSYIHEWSVYYLFIFEVMKCTSDRLLYVCVLILLLCGMLVCFVTTRWIDP